MGRTTALKSSWEKAFVFSTPTAQNFVSCIIIIITMQIDEPYTFFK